ncbi:baculoviral IAP repeat-containing protein 7-like [Mya arenaria]|uniref:baculoviral IAP repeat-containing protein 7-like n=1 Tax=Mya arenaria TaxID=6604 RepID=UPI0022E3DCFD|nr:baculoviral IAP repeat-containing protein 7-like [Mya arenaria]
MAARNSCSDVVSTKQKKEGSKPTPLALGISTLKPKYPQYALASRRTASFTGASTPWPADAHVKVEDLVDAGLVYTGVQDSVRCYHCGGGLRNWEPGDDPMVEHAKWYPACHHVLITKGKMFIRKVEDGDNPEDDTPSMTEDFRCDSLNTAVQAVIENGYPKEDAMRAISVIRNKNGPHAKITATDIASILLEAEDDPNFFLSFGVDNSEHSCSTQECEANDMTRLEQENEELKATSRCKICLSGRADVVFLPCGHIVSCSQCAPALSTCPVCRKDIMGLVKAYFASNGR